MLINPRLTEACGISVAQHEMDFAIPFLNEDVPLYVDPFLLWRSPSMQDKALHLLLINAFNQLGHLAQSGRRHEAVDQLVAASECDEVGLGSSASRKGKRIGTRLAEQVIDLFEQVPAYNKRGFTHFEEIQFFVDGISKDRISDIACSFLKSFLIDFTTDECRKIGLPTTAATVPSVYDPASATFVSVVAHVPVHPETGLPILLVPKRWLRYVPWINYEEYFRHYCPQDDISHIPEEVTHVRVLQYNRENYGVVLDYVASKERTQADCAVDPLFRQIPILSAKRHAAKLKSLPSGKTDGADIEYEKIIGSLLPSLLYPHLDFAAEQSRTDSGVSIRDLIFYNTRRQPFLQEVMADYGSRQIVMELKNVAQVDRTHIDQVNRYLAEELGRFGVLVTRNRLKNAERRRLVDLWSGQRKAVVVLTDEDVLQMTELFESKQREPLDVVVRNYVDFRRECP